MSQKLNMSRIKLKGINNSLIKKMNNIRGVNIKCVHLNNGELIDIHVKSGLVILFVSMGSGRIIDSSNTRYDKKLGSNSFFILKACDTFQLEAKTHGTVIVEFHLSDYNVQEYESNLPMIIEEKDKVLVVDSNKTPITTSTMWLQKNILPGIIIGGVSSRGENKVPFHKHPKIEQVFISLSNNQAKLVIDGLHVDFHENEVIHIPLGSEHGVESSNQGMINYIWLDFIEIN